MTTQTSNYSSAVGLPPIAMTRAATITIPRPKLDDMTAAVALSVIALHMAVEFCNADGFDLRQYSPAGACPNWSSDTRYFYPHLGEGSDVLCGQARGLMRRYFA